MILSEIIYWYRPRSVKAELTGEVHRQERRFKADKLQRSFQSLGDHFGVSKRRARDACHRLERAGLITIEVRDINVNGIACSNVTFLEPVPEMVAAITHPPETGRRISEGDGTFGCSTSCSEEEDVYTDYPENGECENVAQSPADCAPRWKKPRIPNWEEVCRYASERDYHEESVRAFFDLNERNGWTTSPRNPIRNWRAALDAFLKTDTRKAWADKPTKDELLNVAEEDADEDAEAAAVTWWRLMERSNWCVPHPQTREPEPLRNWRPYSGPG